MGKRPKLLWVGELPVPDNVIRAADGWDIVQYDRSSPLEGQLASVMLAVVCPGPDALESLVSQFEAVPGVSILLLPADAQQAWQIMSQRQGRFLCVADDTPAGELSARFEAVGAVCPIVWNLQDELSVANKAVGGAADTVKTMNEEMTLAGRLQRDFLPRQLPQVKPVSFAVLFKPLGWVSGDIYDVARLDETHLGFYVVDVVGHGMPAALLTMFVKKALQTKRIEGHNYQIIPPAESLSQLNDAICQENLPSCQFCTAVHGVLDVESLQLTYAGAGHPSGLLVHRGSSIDWLKASGPLLGVMPQATFEPAQVQLSPGDRLVLYTDGLEDTMKMRGKDIAGTIVPQSNSSAKQMLVELSKQIEPEVGAQKPIDDITAIIAAID